MSKERRGLSAGNRSEGTYTPLPMYRHKLLSAEEEVELCRRIKAGSIEAQNSLVMHNMRLVVIIAKKYGWSEMGADDLVQEGVIGLVTAAQKYDHGAGRFATYAQWWVRQNILRAIKERDKVIRVPTSMQDVRYKIHKTFQELGPRASVEAVAKQTGFSEEKIERILSEQEITISFDEPITSGTETRTVIGDMISDTRTFQSDVSLEAFEAWQQVRREVEAIRQCVRSHESISERDSQIFDAFYTHESPPFHHTVADTARQFNLTDERIRQVLIKIWRMLSKGRRKGEMSHKWFVRKLAQIDELEALVHEDVMRAVTEG